MLALTVTTACASIAGLDGYAEPLQGAGGAQLGGGGTSETTTGGGGTAGGGGGACTYEAAVYASEPFALWRLDELPGVSGFVDEMNGPFLVNEDAQPGQPAIVCGGGSAVDFTDGRAYMPSDSATMFDFAGKASFTVEAWVSPPPSVFDPDGEPFDLVRKLDDSVNQGWILRLHAGQVKWRRIVSSGESNNLFENIDPQQDPLYVVAVYDGVEDQMCSYANGQPLGCTDSVIFSLPTTSADLVVGSGPGGVLDELAFYDRALTLAEIGDHYDAGK